jgi:putative transcriptional regulator
MPTHHPPEDVLVAYASGSAPEPVSLVVSTHLALCWGCRDVVDQLEAVGGELLGDIEPAFVPDALLDAVLARVAEPVLPEVRRPPASVPTLLPEPLRSYVPDPIPWKTLVPGIQKYDLPLVYGSEHVVLTRLRGGVTVPAHGHRGPELQLVLSGGFTDREQHFVRGDIQVADPDLVHGLRIDAGEPCVTLLVRDARLVQHTLAGKVFGWLTGA